MSSIKTLNLTLVVGSYTIYSLYIHNYNIYNISERIIIYNTVLHTSLY